MESKQLFIKYLDNQCTPEEEREVNKLLAQPEMLSLLHTLMEERDSNATGELTDEDYTALGKTEHWQRKVNQRIAQSVLDDFEAQSQQRSSIRLWIRYAAVFVGILLLGTGALLITNNEEQNQNSLADATQGTTIDAGQATLTLADGSVVALANLKQGTIALENGVQIEKAEDGSIVYSIKDKSASYLANNTISTPRGAQHQITLPDGSKAWLNAQSSLTYPIRFKAEERRVKMTGEVYFEIAKLQKQDKSGRVPFFVETANQEIQVLGTEFNVNAYTDEPAIRTTLIEGSVRIATNNGVDNVLLKPGQQALLTEGFIVKTCAVQQEIAWKNGDFVFQGESLDNILRQLSRWYDIEIQCPSHLGNLRFNGMVARSKPLSTVVEIIQSTNKVNIKLEGRRLIVTD
ncbi:FecR family protein [Sphingobacterium tabacisoli]|uniref:FecR family protein n=1 Tax=Sphingobacterium tabacisoli TaxID=2044855 RepID=A0ABW5L3Q6_9SPHI|nr:FecR domain-containing protein [Sphingobacterium tabacisoli]